MWGLENEEVADVLLEELQIFFLMFSVTASIKVGKLGLSVKLRTKKF